MNRQNGHTLIELMVVVAIIGFLTVVAVPAYSNYMREQKFSEVPLILEAARGKSEQNFGDAKTYSGGNCATAGTKSWTVSCTGDTANLSITITGAAGDSNVAGYVFNETSHQAGIPSTSNTVVPGAGPGTGQRPDTCGFILKPNGC